MQYREIPYNYSSFSDKEIITKFIGTDAWHKLEDLRHNRNTGRSAKMLFEIFGDMWVVERNPYLQEDLINNTHRFNDLISAMNHRLEQINKRANNNQNVVKIIQKTAYKIKKFEQDLINNKLSRKVITKKLLKITNKNNIRFDPLSRASHATDASDWRVCYPLVVLAPDTEKELILMIKACIDLQLNIIARGGGTGYTGSGIPLTSNTAIINTEKLSVVSKIYKIDNNYIIRAGSGAITKSVAIAAQKQQLIFAVDPTSQDSCTIGGNIAMNAGGKKALRFGTTIDNLLSWKMIMPDGDLIEVRRLQHNFNKIQLVNKIHFKITNLTTKSAKQLTINTNTIRQFNLGKDVTNKFMQGLPGVQKEGCDGIITSAEFILHKPLKYINTICIEFFGFDTKAAVNTIVLIKNSVENNTHVELIGMEHLDYRYIKAVNYSTKSNRFCNPRMLLMIDISSNNENELAVEINNINIITSTVEAETFIAKNYSK